MTLLSIFSSPLCLLLRLRLGLNHCLVLEKAEWHRKSETECPCWRGVWFRFCLQTWLSISRKGLRLLPKTVYNVYMSVRRISSTWVEHQKWNWMARTLGPYGFAFEVLTRPSIHIGNIYNQQHQISIVCGGVGCDNVIVNLLISNLNIQYLNLVNYNSWKIILSTLLHPMFYRLLGIYYALQVFWAYRSNIAPAFSLWGGGDLTNSAFSMGKVL